MSIPFKSITAASSYFLCLLILISRGTMLVTSLFFVPSMLKTSNEKFIGFVCILLFLTSYLSISIYVHSESTNVLTLRFFVFTFTYTFNSLLTLLHWFGITYLFWEFTGEISHTVPIRDLLQNFVSCPSLHRLYPLILPGSFISSLIAFLCNPWLCALLCRIWNISEFPSLSSSSILWPYTHICCNWSTSAFHLWNCHCYFQCPWAVLTLHMSFLFLFCNHVVLLWAHIPVLLR